MNPAFRTEFAETIFNQKYRHEGADTWEELARTLVMDVCYHPKTAAYFTKEEADELVRMIAEMKFIPGGRYLYYAGRRNKFFNNCFIFRSKEDTRENWSDLTHKVQSCLMTGGGIGNDYSVYRASGSKLNSTGGVASGPLSAANMQNEVGRYVMQGGSRRSAIYASLNWKHKDAKKWIYAKDWRNMMIADTGISYFDAKQKDFNFPAPFDMTNMSLNFDTEWLMNYWKTGDYGETFLYTVIQALQTGEPGFSFNFFEKENETGRNACTEVTSDEDGDVCNLGSANLSRIETISEFARVVELGTRFLLAGTEVSQVPLPLIQEVRERNRRLGLGIMGVHEWLIQRGSRYEVTPELHRWLRVYQSVSDHAAATAADRMGVARPKGRRAIAPTGTIGILAGTSTGIEPIFAVAYKRRFLDGTTWKYQYVVDGAARELIERYDADPDTMESALDLANDFERRIAAQADVQDYVDMAISSTINIPQWGTEFNNRDRVKPFAETLAKYAHRLRGFTVYPDGARGGQPLTAVPYSEAVESLGKTFEEAVQHVDICDITGKGGSCGV